VNVEFNQAHRGVSSFYNYHLHCQFCGAALEALTTACPFCGAQPVLGDRYEVRALIGRGGMGEVFLGYDRRLANEVAIKRLPPQFASSPELRDSLEKEARILARLSDAAIVRLFDLAEFHGDLYLILEYVCGPSLREMLRSGYKARPLELAELMGEICRGLTVAHEAGVIHRDLKPSNLLLSLGGEARAAFAASRQLPGNLSNVKVKIADFGIAKAIADSGSTFTNAFSGTPGYMAPEQFRGEMPGPETDVYALGVITREICPPGGLLPAVTAVVNKATSANRANRFPSAASFYDALCEAIEGRSPRRAPLKPARRPINRRLLLALGLLMAAAFGIGLLAVVLPSHSPARRPLTELPFEDNAIAIEWHSAPRVNQLPPIVEAARGRLPGNGLAGPQNPKLLWSVSLNAVGMRIVAIGTDGTVYASSMEGICAVRDGKLKWAYKSGMGGSNVQIDDNGRIWYGSSLDGNYCVNRDGEGGRLPGSIPRPELNSETYRYSCVMNHTLTGPGWQMELDGDCTSAGVVRGSDGRVYVATDLPQILAVSPAGAVAWKYAAKCNALSLVPVLANEIVYACKDQSLYGVTRGVESWERNADGEFNWSMLADSAGTVYYGDYGRENGSAHLHAVDAQGHARWTIDMHRATITNLALNNRRQLCAAASFLHSRLMCLGD
jgi:serine/threonine protein kinase